MKHLADVLGIIDIVLAGCWTIAAALGDKEEQARRLAWACLCGIATILVLK